MHFITYLDAPKDVKMVYCITTRDNTVHALLANYTVTWQPKFRTCRSSVYTFCWNFRSLLYSLVGTKFPGVELSLPGTFALWNFRSQKRMVLGAKSP